MSIDQGSVAVRLRTLRADFGMSQREVAAAVGVTQGTVSNWEHGLQPLPAACVDPMARLYHVPASYLCDESACFTPPLFSVAERLQRRLRRPPVLPPYPSRGTLAEMLALGSGAQAVYSDAVVAAGQAVVDWAVERLPRDSSHELCAALQLIVAGARPMRCTLGQLGCRLLVVDGPQTRQSATTAMREVLVLQRDNRLLVFVPQPCILLPRWNRCCRPDLLTLVVGGSQQWFDLEVDGRHHDDQGGRRHSKGRSPGTRAPRLPDGVGAAGNLWRADDRRSAGSKFMSERPGSDTDPALSHIVADLHVTGP